MPLSSELLDVLVCPKCKSKVRPKADESALICTNENCRLAYPVREEIPVMLIEEAKVEN